MDKERARLNCELKTYAPDFQQIHFCKERYFGTPKCSYTKLSFGHSRHLTTVAHVHRDRLQIQNGQLFGHTCSNDAVSTVFV